MARKRAIPLVELSDFTKGDEASKKAFIKKLSKAFHEIGFVGVVNHGIPKALVNKFYAESQAFFMLPTEKKQKYEVPGLAGQRGYTSFGKEHAKQSKVGDLKEFFQIGQEVKGKDPIKKEYPKNVYVRERPQYLATGIKLYQSFERSGGKLLKAIAIHLGLGEKYFDPKIKNGNSILRSIYYPPNTPTQLTPEVQNKRNNLANAYTTLVDQGRPDQAAYFAREIDQIDNPAPGTLRERIRSAKERIITPLDGVGSVPIGSPLIPIPKIADSNKIGHPSSLF